MFELWINDLINVSRLSPWAIGVYELWTEPKPAPAGAYLRWMEIHAPEEVTPEIAHEALLRAA
jgi:hypothetical protein